VIKDAEKIKNCNQKLTKNHRYRFNYKGNLFAEPLKFDHQALDSSGQNLATTFYMIETLRK
jgi:hypothetical protein